MAGGGMFENPSLRFKIGGNNVVAPHDPLQGLSFQNAFRRCLRYVALMPDEQVAQIV